MNEQADFSTTQNDSLHAVADHALDNVHVLLLGAPFDAAENELIINYPIHHVALFSVGNTNLQAVLLCEPAFVKLFFHREACTQQSDVLDTRSMNIYYLSIYT